MCIRDRVYRIQCVECDKFYIGQTGRKFIERFKEHLPKKKPQTTSSNYALHLINENHNYTGFKENMEPIHVCNKGHFLNALEEFEIYKVSKVNK